MLQLFNAALNLSCKKKKKEEKKRRKNLQLDIFSRVPSENFQVTDVKQCVGKSNLVPENGKPLLCNMCFTFTITSGSVNWKLSIFDGVGGGGLGSSVCGGGIDNRLSRLFFF